MIWTNYLLFVQADFIEELFRGRFVEEQFTAATLTAYGWQVFILISFPPPMDLFLSDFLKNFIKQYALVVEFMDVLIHFQQIVKI